MFFANNLLFRKAQKTKKVYRFLLYWSKTIQYVTGVFTRSSDNKCLQNPSGFGRTSIDVTFDDYQIWLLRITFGKRGSLLGYEKNNLSSNK